MSKSGFAAAQHAELCHKLMLQLGYEQYLTQGGDWGYVITRVIGTIYPEGCKASHINMTRAKPPQVSKNSLLALQHSIIPYTKKEKWGLERSKWLVKEGFGQPSLTYISVKQCWEHDHRLQPDTIHQVTNTSIRPPRLFRRSPYLDLRKVPRLDL